MNILVTGGAGYIGSHTIVELAADGHTIVVIDSFVNSDLGAINRLEKLIGQPVDFTEADIRNTEHVKEVLKDKNIDCVIHFAALKAVGESVKNPILYYQNNLDGLLSLLDAMQQAGVNNLIFSSSATVYGDPDSVPIDESFPLKPANNPYGATKQMAEKIIDDVCATGTMKAVLLRYFNPIGAHPSGLIGELPNGPPNNLVPYVTQAAAGLRDTLTVFGDDFNTPDGSGVRDYIHVVDLAKAHVKAANYLTTQKAPVSTFNIGTGQGSSVLEVIKTFEKVNNVTVPYAIGPRRPGDIATCYASADKANDLLSWKAELSLEEALKDAWRWQQNITKK